MDNKEQFHDPIAEFRSRINLYSYICQITFVFLDLLIGGVSLITAHDDGLNLTVLWIAFGSSVVSLIFIAVLSALYFAGDDEERNSYSRMKATLSIRMTLRGLGLLTMILFLIHLGFFQKTATSWSNFLYVYAILGLIVSGLSLIYAIWKLAWMKQNPERYETVYGLHGGRDVTKKEPGEKDFSSKKTPAKKDAKAKNEIIEVDAHDKK
jgi:cytochrome bd-type quinol oxidase subunit 2